MLCLSAGVLGPDSLRTTILASSEVEEDGEEAEAEEVTEGMRCENCCFHCFSSASSFSACCVLLLHLALSLLPSFACVFAIDRHLFTSCSAVSRFDRKRANSDL